MCNFKIPLTLFYYGHQIKNIKREAAICNFDTGIFTLNLVSFFLGRHNTDNNNRLRLIFIIVTC